MSMVGRGALVSRACGHLVRRGGGSVVFTGPAGIGKSTLVNAVAGEVPGRVVLRCSPAESERHLPFLGLIDLLAETGDDVLERLPEQERTVLRSALLRGGDPVGERGILALRVAVQGLFRVLCAERPVLLVIDDAQWLDRPSTELLAFVARRAAGLDVAMVAAVRAGPGIERPDAICPAPVLTLRVPEMSAAEVAALLEERWPRPVLGRIHQASGGNPFFALEIGRALAERGDPDDDELPLPDGLRALMRERLGVLAPRARQTLVVASAAARPTVPLLARAGCPRAAADVADAVRHGIAEITPGNVIRFSHPLLSAVVYAEAAPEDRLRAHAELAETATDPVERARHLALVAPGPDSRIAATLSAAADAARRRGAPAVAARLGRQAADLTPGDAPPDALDRRLTAAEDAVAAGEFGTARAIAHDVLAASPDPARRVRAWILVMDSSGQALSEVGDVFPQALSDARDDPALLAPLHYRLAWRAWMVEGSAAAAHAHVARSARLAAEAGDRRTEVMALSKQAHVEFFLGRPEAELTLARALADPQDPRVAIDHNGPSFQKHRYHLLNDRLDEARTELRALIYLVRQRGVVESLCNCQHNLARVEIHRGRCERALELARQSLRLAEDSGISQGPSWYAIALAEAAGGDLERAAAAAERAQRLSEDDGDQLFLPQARHAAGLVRLMRGRYTEAAAILRRVRRMDERQGLMDPAMRRWHGDLAEALARAGAVEEAAELVAVTRERARRLDRRSVLAVLDRAAGQVAEARGEPEEAVRLLRRSAAALAELPFRLEEGRARLALGRALARTGETGAARTALRDARRVFSGAHARPWLDLVAAELDGVPESPLPASLTGIESKVAALVADGATNREIAARLVISVKTVEAALTRTYRKLGVRSRVDLARLAADHPPN